MAVTSALDQRDGAIEPILETAYSEGFKGLNDLHFSSRGDLYFTDQGQTGITDPSGRVFRYRADGGLEKLAVNVPSPNGITLNNKENQVYVAVTRSQQLGLLILLLAFGKREDLLRRHEVSAGLARVLAEGAVAAIVAAKGGKRDEDFFREGDDSSLPASANFSGGAQ